jgi:uncharacterized membrane protein
MKTKHFLNAVEHDRVHRAIRAAEKGTSGDVVLFISHRPVSDALAEAEREFSKLRLDTAAEQNGLLIFLAPESQTFAAMGGSALHAQVGQAWWDELVALLGRHFKAGRYTDGLVAALEKSGHVLRRHFPSTAVDRTGQFDIVEE